MPVESSWSSIGKTNQEILGLAKSHCCLRHPGSEIEIVAIFQKDARESYLFLVDDNDYNRQETCEKAGCFAANKKMSFTWEDAFLVSQKICPTHQKTHPPSFPTNRISTWSGDEESD